MEPRTCHMLGKCSALSRVLNGKFCSELRSPFNFTDPQMIAIHFYTFWACKDSVYIRKWCAVEGMRVGTILFSSWWHRLFLRTTDLPGRNRVERGSWPREIIFHDRVFPGPELFVSLAERVFLNPGGLVEVSLILEMPYDHTSDYLALVVWTLRN